MLVVPGAVYLEVEVGVGGGLHGDSRRLGAVGDYVSIGFNINNFG